MQGRRFNFDRTLLRIPVSYRYRLLCRWQSGQIIPLQVLSHESYNAVARIEPEAIAKRVETNHCSEGGCQPNSIQIALASTRLSLFSRSAMTVTLLVGVIPIM